MDKNFDSSEKYIDIGDVVERYESIEETEYADEIEERDNLKSLLDELKGYGGDEQWRGDWYPITLIRDDEFENAMDELLEDIGDMPKCLPCYLSIVVDYKALQSDYSSVEFDGATYWYR